MDEENWDDGQFNDAKLLYNHNSTEESDRIHCEYSVYFEKVEDQQYSPYHTTQGVEYHIPEPDYLSYSRAQANPTVERGPPKQKVKTKKPPIEDTKAETTSTPYKDK